MTGNRSKLTYREKAMTVFIEYFVFSFLFLIVHTFIVLLLNLDFISYWFLTYFTFFFTYYSFCELVFRRTLVMWFFGIELERPIRFNIEFIVYSVSSILDRTIFAPFHALLALLNNGSLLFSEKISDVRWKYIKEDYDKNF